MNESSRINKIIKGVIKIICVLVSTYLFLMTSFSSSYAGYKKDGDGFLAHFYYGDYVIVIIAVLILALIVLCKFGICIPKRDDHSFWNKLNRNRLKIYLIYAILGFVFVFTTRLEPASDPEKCFNVARALINGDFADFFSQEGYMFRCPHQNGLVLFDMALLKLFGDNAFLAFQCINVVFEILAIEFIGRIAEMICSGDETVGIKTRTLLILFPVWFFNITYNYGIVICTSLVIIAIYYEIKYIKERKLIDMIFSSIAIALGIVIKLNATVFMIGMVLFLLWDLLLINRNYRNIIFIVLIVAFRMFAVNAANGVVENITGLEISHGIPALNYVAMGISGNGTYSGRTVDIYRASGWDVAVSNEMAKEDIMSTLTKYYNDKSYALSWLGRKLSLEWANPTYGSLRHNTGRGDYYALEGFYKSIFEQTISGPLVIYLNLLEGLILLGFMYFAISFSSKKDLAIKLILMVCLVGGFTFHIFWEGAFDYVLPYFVVALPCAVEGLHKLLTDIRDKNRTPVVTMIVLAAVIAIAYILRGGVLFDSLIKIIDPKEVLDSFTYFK